MNVYHTYSCYSILNFIFLAKGIYICLYTYLLHSSGYSRSETQYFANTCQKQEHRIFPCSVKAEEFQLVYVTFLIQSIWSKAPVKLDFEYFWGFCNWEILRLIERLFLPKPLAKNILAHLRVRMIILATMPH